MLTRLANLSMYRSTEAAALIVGLEGIGLETARRLLTGGWRVCITGRKVDVLAEADRLLRTAGADALLAVPGAAEDGEHQRQAVADVTERWGRLDALVVNAAVSPYYGPITDVVDRSDPPGVRGQRYCAMDVGDRGVGRMDGRPGWEHRERRLGRRCASFAWQRRVQRVEVGAAPPHPTAGRSRAGAAVRVNAVAPATIRTGFSKAKFDGREAVAPSIHWNGSENPTT